MNEDAFKLSKRIRDKLKQKEALHESLIEGKSAQEILEFSDETMGKFYQAAHGLLEQNRYEDATNAFIFLVTLNPLHPEYWMGLGAALHFTHDYEAAIDAYEIAAIYDLENPIPYFYLAKCLFAIHDRTAAMQALDLAIEYAKDKQEHSTLRQEAIKAKEILFHS